MAEPDVVLCTTGRGPWVPQISNFQMKLETYLRMAKIPYKNHFEPKLSSKGGKTPFILYKGEEMEDSQLIMEFLDQEYDIDLNKHLSDLDRSIAHAFRKLIEDDIYWYGAMWRFRYCKEDREVYRELLPWIAVEGDLTENFEKNFWGHGCGRKSEEANTKNAMDGMMAVSTFMGDKKFLMGDEPSVVDCTVFGLLAHVKWSHPNCPANPAMRDLTPNLWEYCDRMKDLYWPDWDDCITHGLTRKATK